MSRPNTIFGCGSLGSPIIGQNFSTSAQVQGLLDQLKALGIDRLDTAARYSPGNPGGSEQLIGEVRAAAHGFTIDTKINIPDVAIADGAGSLTAAAIANSINKSLDRLKVDKVHILHFHRSDPVTPIAEQTAEIQKQYLAGRFEKFGVSNFSAEQVAELVAVCEANGYIKPSVFQGSYNLIDREIEQSLFPLLRKHNIVFNAYSPLASGFLTGRATRGDIEGTRFSSSNPISSSLNGIYNKPHIHKAITSLLDALEPLQISGSGACLRWLYYHSVLQEGDGVIMGASKLPQIVQNIDDIARGPLPAEVVRDIDLLWENLQI
ncbi:hypothetical protein N7540_013096 [Penicillium herquei]|nr:hypothetical protein N7540_013242 [Penicillium herquei]KAJ6004727.1 hypothetical protein N7540_013096 [Penicillium herquei]